MMSADDIRMHALGIAWTGEPLATPQELNGMARKMSGEAYRHMQCDDDYLRRLRQRDDELRTLWQARDAEYSAGCRMRMWRAVAFSLVAVIAYLVLELVYG